MTNEMWQADSSVMTDSSTPAFWFSELHGRGLTSLLPRFTKRQEKLQQLLQLKITNFNISVKTINKYIYLISL